MAVGEWASVPQAQTLGWVTPKNHCASACFRLFLVISVNYFPRNIIFPPFYPFSFFPCFGFLKNNFLVLKVIKAKIVNPRASHEKSLVCFLVVTVIFRLCGLELPFAFIS